MFVKERFRLDNDTRLAIRDIEPQFGYNGYGEFIFYRTYSRDRFNLFCQLYNGTLLSSTKERTKYFFTDYEDLKNVLSELDINIAYVPFQNEYVLTGLGNRIELNGKTYFPRLQENYHDAVIRVIEGTFSIRKDWYIKNYISWNEKFWQDYAKDMSISMTKMEWLPPGRGMWAMGTPFVYERGGMALYNCFAGETRFLTDQGLINFKDNVGLTVKVKCVDGEWRDAEIKSFGEQKLYIMRLFGGGYFYVTGDHEWLLDNDDVRQTTVLRKGDTLKSGHRVYRVTETNRYEEVYCVTEEETHTFTLEDGVLTKNCAYTEVHNNDLAEDLCWTMDSLMLGVGVGFSPLRQPGLKFKPISSKTYDNVIPDSREGWVDSCKQLWNSLINGTPRPRMIYDEIRPKGLLIRGFGGLASGPDPLRDQHGQIYEMVEKYETDAYYDEVILKTDAMNQTGVTVCSGNVRRSAEKANLSIKDEVFKNLKRYDIYPERKAWGYMSNNSVDLEDDSDFELLGEIADRVKENAEPGYNNLQNFPYGRIGKKDNVRKDRGKSTNPCGEIVLEGSFDIDGKSRVREVCNINQTYPTKHNNPEIWLKSCEYATVYCSTVSLLPTHQPSTNRVVARNRRIGVSVADYTGWIQNESVNKVTKLLREGYDIVTKTNQWVNSEAGVPEAIRKTTIVPGGTVPKVVGVTAGAGYPTFMHTLRNTRVAKNANVHSLLVDAGFTYEQDVVDKYTDVFGWPILQGPAPPAEKVSLWQQAMNLVLLQREWADNAVSNTLYFKPKWLLVKDFKTDDEVSNFLSMVIKDNSNYINAMARLHDEDIVEVEKYKIKINYDEDDEIVNYNIYKYNPNHEEDSIEAVLSAIAPLTKTVSLLPHTTKGVYAQMPEEGITEEEYNELIVKLKKIDWSKLNGSDGMDERYCQGDLCEIIKTS